MPIPTIPRLTKSYGAGTHLAIGTSQRISEIARDMKSPALGDERSEEYLDMVECESASITRHSEWLAHRIHLM